MERSGGALVFRIHVSAFIEKKFHSRERTEPGGVMERRRACQVLRLNQGGVRSEKLRNGASISGTDSGNDSGELWIERLGWSFVDNIDEELGALIDPGTQESDLVFGERTSGRHLHSAVATYKTSNQFTVGAFAGNDDGPVVTATQCVLSAIETKAGLLNIVSMATVALLLE
jgi:hypothetical protein